MAAEPIAQVPGRPQPQSPPGRLSRRAALGRLGRAAAGVVALGVAAVPRSGEAAPATPVRPASAFSADVATAWFALSLALIRDSPGFNPPVASRVFAYAGLALYEAVVPGMPGYRSLGGRLKDLPPLPPPADPAHHWPSVANSALASVLRRLVPVAPEPQLAAVAALEEEFATRFRAAVPPGVHRRSVDRGRQVADRIFAWSTTDGGHEGYLQNFPATYAPPVGPGLWVPTPPGFLPALQPFWGTNRPFALAAGEACDPGPRSPASTAASTSVQPSSGGWTRARASGGRSAPLPSGRKSVRRRRHPVPRTRGEPTARGDPRPSRCGRRPAHRRPRAAGARVPPGSTAATRWTRTSSSSASTATCSIPARPATCATPTRWCGDHQTGSWCQQVTGEAYLPRQVAPRLCAQRDPRRVLGPDRCRVRIRGWRPDLATDFTALSALPRLGRLVSAPVVMLHRTASGVGKSVVAADLGRALRRRGGSAQPPAPAAHGKPKSAKATRPPVTTSAAMKVHGRGSARGK